MTHYRSHGRNRHLAFEASEQWSCHQSEPISVVFGGFVVLFKRTFAFRQVCHLGTFAHGEGRRKGKLVPQLRGEKHWKNSVNVHWSPVIALCLPAFGISLRCGTVGLQMLYFSLQSSAFLTCLLCEWEGTAVEARWGHEVVSRIEPTRFASTAPELSTQFNLLRKVYWLWPNGREPHEQIGLAVSVSHPY